MMNLAGKTVGRKPLGHGVGVQECAIDALGRGAEHAVEFMVPVGMLVLPFALIADGSFEFTTRLPPGFLQKRVA